jgi:hypothetical protein
MYIDNIAHMGNHHLCQYEYQHLTKSYTSIDTCINDHTQWAPKI